MARPDPAEKFVSVQISPVSFIDEGVDQVLDTLQERVGEPGPLPSILVLFPVGEAQAVDGATQTLHGAGHRVAMELHDAIVGHQGVGMGGGSLPEELRQAFKGARSHHHRILSAERTLDQGVKDLHRAPQGSARP